MTNKEISAPNSELLDICHKISAHCCALQFVREQVSQVERFWYIVPEAHSWALLKSNFR